MSKIHLEYTGTEAIELMKQYYPTCWEIKIQEKAELLKRMKKNWKLESIEDTYKKYMSYVGSAVSSIEMLSALQTIKNNEPPLKSIHDQIKELIKNQDNVLKQQESLESTTNINSFDKQSLRQFYNDKQQKYASQLTELTNSIEVINPNIITVQRSLFHESD